MRSRSAMVAITTMPMSSPRPSAMLNAGRRPSGLRPPPLCSLPRSQLRQVVTANAPVQPGQLLTGVERAWRRKHGTLGEATAGFGSKTWQPCGDEGVRPVAHGRAQVEIDEVDLELLPTAAGEYEERALLPPTSRVRWPHAPSGTTLQAASIASAERRTSSSSSAALRPAPASISAALPPGPPGY